MNVCIRNPMVGSGIGSILTPLVGKFSEDTRKKGKGGKTGASHDWGSFYLSQYDWLKGSHMTEVVWLPNEIDYSYCEFLVPNTPYCKISSSGGCMYIYVTEIILALHES